MARAALSATRVVVTDRVGSRTELLGDNATSFANKIININDRAGEGDPVSPFIEIDDRITTGTKTLINLSNISQVEIIVDSGG